MTRRKVMILLFLGLIAPGSVQSRNWHITPDGTGDAPTIQAGIDSAATGDEVVLAPGLYTWTSQAATGTSMIRLKPGLVLRSEGDANATVLDAELQGRLLLCADVGTEVRIQGLTLQNGFVSQGGSEPGGGAGLLAVGASEPTIIGCTIRENHAFQPSNGGGIYCNVATIDDCVFLDNDGFRGGGGAIACGAARITNCEFRRNGQGDGGAGGAIAAGSAHISDCFFEENGVGSGMLAPGGAIFASGATVIESCLFVRNTAAGVFGEGGAASRPPRQDGTRVLSAS